MSHRRKNLRLTYVDGFFYAIMVGTAESFAIFYGLQRGLNIEEIAIVSTFPILIGALSQWIIPFFIANHQLKSGIILSVALQLFGLIGFLYLPFAENIFFPLLISLIFYWIGGMVAGPLWLDWVSPWLPHRSFTTYLSRRNGILSLITLISFVSSAFLIHFSGYTLAFLLVFILALVARMGSLFVFFKQQNPEEIKKKTRAIDLAMPLVWAKKPVYIIIALTTLFRFAANTSGPFFMPYMVQELKLNLLDYVFLSAIPFAGRWLYLSRWGTVAKKFRPFIVLQVTMFGIAINPILWTLGNHMSWLAIIELYSGIMWSGFELCTILIIQNFWPGSARRLIGFHLALMSLFSLLGAWIGSQIHSHRGNYHELFLISSTIRIFIAIAAVAALATVKETRYRLSVYGDFLSTMLSLRPSLANIGRIIPLRRTVKNFFRLPK
jgi:hypothetical protein